MKARSLLGATILTAITLASGSAFAQSTANQQAASNSGAQASGGDLVFSPTYGGSTNRYAASSAIAPQLVAGIDTCMGSSSVGGSATTFSFSIGTTWTDKDCRRVKDARELWNMGQHTAAMALLCTDDDTRYAIAVSGGLPVRRDDGATIHVPCPISKEEWVKAGRPMLDPATGQPYTTAQLNPQAPVAAVPSAQLAVTAYEKLPANVKAAIANQAKADEIEAKVAAIKAQGATLASK